jgi:hypothetical protein
MMKILLSAGRKAMGFLPDGKGILFLRHKIPGGSKPPPYIDYTKNYTGKQNQESGIENNS